MRLRFQRRRFYLTSEHGLETVIVTALVDETAYLHDDPQDYDRDHAVDLTQLLTFHSYTVKQAIQEGFIFDVLKNYTPVVSYYRLMKKSENDPEFDARRATKKLQALRRVSRPRRPPEGRDHD